MNENEEKKFTKNLNEHELFEKEFHKTKYGKFMRAVLILTCVVLAIGLILSAFQAVVYARNLDIDKYQPIINLGEICMDYSGEGAFFCMFIYAIFLPIMMKENDEIQETSSKKGKVDISKFIKSPLFKVITVALVIIYVINFLYDVGMIVGQLIFNVNG